MYQVKNVWKVDMYNTYIKIKPIITSNTLHGDKTVLGQQIMKYLSLIKKSFNI